MPKIAILVFVISVGLLSACTAQQSGDNPQLEAAAQKVLDDLGIRANTSRMTTGQLGAIVSIGNSSRDFSSRRGLVRSVASRSNYQAGSLCWPNTDSCLIPRRPFDAQP
ncbi:MAG: hypothetical protein AAF667_19685 [Pseudomonadota bacterium]